MDALQLKIDHLGDVFAYCQRALLLSKRGESLMARGDECAALDASVEAATHTRS
jgi:hypothetical protein